MGYQPVHLLVARCTSSCSLHLHQQSLAHTACVPGRSCQPEQHLTGLPTSSTAIRRRCRKSQFLLRLNSLLFNKVSLFPQTSTIRLPHVGYGGINTDSTRFHQIPGSGDRVQCGRVALHRRSMPCWRAFVDQKVVSVLGGCAVADIAQGPCPPS